MKLSSAECSLAYYDALPDIEFSFYDINMRDGKNAFSNLTVDLTLIPQDYMINKNSNSISDDESKDNCVPGFGNNGLDMDWQIGIMLLRKFVMIYDFKNDRVGFVRTTDEG